MALEEIQSKFGGKWKLDRSENFEEFLKEMGVNFMIRKMAGSSKPEQEIHIEGEEIVMSIKAGFWNKESRMKLNEEFEEDRDGVKMKSLCTYVNGTIMSNNTPVDKPNVKNQVVTREIVDDELVMIINVGEGHLICRRFFKRLP